MVDSIATTARPAARASATSGEQDTVSDIARFYNATPDRANTFANESASRRIIELRIVP
jgi:hypothetical protein